MNRSRGFITIATGKEEYYRIAAYLVRSYRQFSSDPLPFAILCDRENEYTCLFDDVILYLDGATNSYLDKLDLGLYLPYDETIFIDADCLAYGDLNKLFDSFRDADDFSCFGRALPLDDKTGWFEYENLGALQEKVTYVVGLHGGIYYMRRGEMTRKIFETAKSLIPDYKSFRFKGKFDTPGDEPLVALSMALNRCRPVPFQRNTICCYWEHENQTKLDISIPEAIVQSEMPDRPILLHWGTRFTRGLVYQEQAEMLDILIRGENVPAQLARCRREYAKRMAQEQAKRFAGRVKNKIKRTIGI